MSLKIGEKSPEARVYACNNCGNFNAYLEGERTTPCEICAGQGIRNVWNRTSQRIVIVTKNVTKEFEKNRTITQKMSDLITDFCGSMIFVYLHSIWFAAWIILNVGMFALFGFFDPFPYGLLTMIVSLEAILLSTFILISQNRQAEKSDMRAKMDYHVNLKAEKEIAEISAKVESIRRYLHKVNCPKKKVKKSKK